MNTNQQAGRQNCQITPFTYENRAVRTVVVENEPWFVAKEVCDILEIQNVPDALKNLDDDERMTIAITDSHSGHRGGAQSLNIVNESGLYHLVFRSRKPEAKVFRKWVTSDVLPKIRQAGSYGNEGDACAGRIYSLFSGCQDMTIQRMNKIIYYFALDPPLSNTDIAKLLCVSDSIITHWRRRLSTKTARKALKALAINAQGIVASKAALPPMREDRPGFPLNLPPREAQDA
jgi:prophage antirepressor-like protein